VCREAGVDTPDGHRGARAGARQGVRPQVSKLVLGCGSSVEYVPHAAAMLHSMLEQSGDLEVEAHYLHGPEMPAEHMRLLAEMVERGGGSLITHELNDDRIAGLPEMSFIPATMWYRIYLPELLPDVDKILYLDADTIAVDALHDLWATDISEHYVAAVTNVFEPWNRVYPIALGLPDEESYFNSGVLLMNLAAMRRDDATTALRDYAFSAPSNRLAWGDQDALNVVLSAKRVRLHPRWNFMNSVAIFPEAEELLGADAVREARTSPAIRHFEGPSINKPWHYLCDRSMRDLYFRHRRETPWPKVRREGVTPLNLVRRTLARRR
jgi:lipopolysaccharide biosynthesis glycosyltransferase